MSPLQAEQLVQALPMLYFKFINVKVKNKLEIITAENLPNALASKFSILKYID